MTIHMKSFNKIVIQGSTIASDRDRREGFLLGAKKGSEIGSEVGFFQSFAKVWIKLISDGDKKNEKVKRELQKLNSLAEKASNQVNIFTVN